VIDWPDMTRQSLNLLFIVAKNIPNYYRVIVGSRNSNFLAYNTFLLQVALFNQQILVLGTSRAVKEALGPQREFSI
jgi:hypothetical protein